ncbi:MAG: MFS transporter [Acidimicrobiales bacterium]|nr:MFS transporter [Acidimicrobiales bacterium]
MDSVDVPAAPTPGPAGSGPAGVSRRQLAWLLGGLMVGLFLSATESSVIATALPTMAGELGGASKLAWVVSAYLLTSTVVTPLYGKLSDLLGRRVVYQSSIALFIAGSLLCGLAQSMNQLVAARAVQGMGGGGLMSLAFVILGDVLSPRERGRYMGLFTGVFAFSSVTGPLWGGLLVDTIGWRWIFLVMLPLGTLALAITSVGLRLPFLTRKRPIDWAGAALLVTGSSALLLVPIWGGGSYGWTSAPVLGAAAIGVALTAALLWWETKAAEPVLPLRLFRDRTVRAVFAMNFGQMFGLIAVATFLPLFLQVATGASATRSGLEMVPQSLAISGTATASGFMVSRWGRYKWTLLAGPLIAALGMASLSTIDSDTTPLGLAPFLVMTGLGLGLSFPNMTIAVQNAVEMADLGVATSTANFFRNMGSTFGAAVMGALLNNRLASTLAERVPAERLSEVGGAEGLVRSPKLVRELDPDLHDAVIEAVTSAVTFVLRLGVPIFVLMFGIALFVKEKPLRTTSVLGGASRRDEPAAGPSVAPVD